VPGTSVLTANLACPASPAVHITGNNVHFDLKGFTLSKTGSAVGTAIITAAGNTCVATSAVHIHNGTITNFGTAIQICVSTPMSLSFPLKIWMPDPLPVRVISLMCACVAIGPGHNNKITNNLIDVGVYHGVGILLSESDGNQIKENAVSFNEADGIRLLNSDHNHISGNTTNTNRESGIHIETGSAKNLVVRNVAHNNASFDLADDNRNCGTNDWDSNSFGTRSQSCIQ
jgi:parallel beta-helix repeat protein